MYDLGFVLGGGGAKGFFEAGVVKRLLEWGYEPQIIAGTSVGSLVGAMLADGHTPDEMLSIFGSLSVKRFLEPKFSREYLVAFKPIRTLLEKTLRAKTFEELQIPLRVMATCLETGQGVVFDSGPLLDALVASCSIPIVFPPVCINGKHYVDGGVVQNLPVSTIRQECRKVIAVNLHPGQGGRYEKNKRYIAMRCVQYMFNANTLLDKSLADFVVEDPAMHSFSAFDLKDAALMFDSGYNSPYLEGIFKAVPLSLPLNGRGRF